MKERKKTDVGNSAIMVYAEVDRGGIVLDVVLELLAKARELAEPLGAEVCAFLPGHGVAEEADRLVAHGADKVFLADNQSLSVYREDLYSKIFVDLLLEEKPAIVLAGATIIGRSLIPRVGVELGAGLTADCIELSINEEGLLLQTKPSFGDNVMARIICPEARPQMCTVRPGVMQPCVADSGHKGEVVRVVLSRDKLISRLQVDEQVVAAQNDTGVAGLDKAEIVIGIGRGLASEKGLALAKELADVMGASLCATRPVVDDGFLPHSFQVGQTGRVVSPRLYIACGISGALQHTVGITSADTVVAINKDGSAPIFSLAVCGIVGDFFAVAPALIRKIRKIKEIKSYGS